jgi:hypothetical protein
MQSKLTRRVLSRRHSIPIGMRASICTSPFSKFIAYSLFGSYRFSTVKESSVIAVQIFDQRKFKRKDQGFLGVVNIKVSEYLDMELDGHGA